LQSATDVCVRLLHLGGDVPVWMTRALVLLEESPSVTVIPHGDVPKELRDGAWHLPLLSGGIFVRVDCDGRNVVGVSELLTVVVDRLPEQRNEPPGSMVFSSGEAVLMASLFLTAADGSRRTIDTVTRTPHRYRRGPNQETLEKAAGSLLKVALCRYVAEGAWPSSPSKPATPVRFLPDWHHYRVLGFSSVAGVRGSWSGAVGAVTKEGYHRTTGYLQWFLGYRNKGGEWQRLMPPSRTFWADPFPVTHQAVQYLFFEQYRYARGLGELMVSTWSEEGWSAPSVVLSEAWHLSYPNVFEHNGEHYMLPEMASAGRVDLYVADQFPNSWRVLATLIPEIEAVDPTLHFQDGVWWLFVSTSLHGSGSADLLLFFATTITGPYSPHPQNPISRDCRVARPAGHLFRDEGALIRPAQDCAVRYGRGVVFQEVSVLTTTHYCEHTVSYQPPTWTHKLEGAHTYNRDGDLEVTDGLRWAPRLSIR
jgi:hypothetical protein